jgi:hypothetical protein
VRKAVIFVSVLVVLGLIGLVVYLGTKSTTAPQPSASGRGIVMPEGPDAVGPTTFPGPSGTLKVNVVRATGGAFAGGITRLPDGNYLAVFQSALNPGAPPAEGNNHVFEIELGPDIMKAPTKDPLDVTARIPQNLVPAKNLYDPGVAVTKDDAVLISWYGYGIQITKRLGPGKYEPPVGLAGFAKGEGPGWWEVTIQTVYGHTLAAYSGPADTQGHKDVFVQEVFSDLTTGPRVRAGGPEGEGPSGHQLRDTIAEAGNGKIMLVWQQVAPGNGPRSIHGSISSDFGRTWGPAVEVASLASRRIDMFNPFIVNTGKELRVYSQSCSTSECQITVTTSTDQGQTWSPPDPVPLPTFSRYFGRPTYIVVDGTVYCFTDVARPGSTRANPQVAGRVLLIFPMPK